jgi:hypothetical protein
VQGLPVAEVPILGVVDIWAVARHAKQHRNRNLELPRSIVPTPAKGREDGSAAPEVA